MSWYVGLFEQSGNMAAPWMARGFRALCIDKLSSDRIEDGIIHLGADLTYWSSWEEISKRLHSALPRRTDIQFDPNDIAFVAAFPPCDHLAVSGARWFKGKGLRKLSQAIELVAVAAELCETSGAPYIIENPVGTLSTYWRKPDYIFHPWQYAGLAEDENYVKKTCLWTGGGFVMPEPCPQKGENPPDERIWRMGPSPDRARLRSVTPKGFAEAVCRENA